MIIIVLSIIRKFAKITINFYNGKINNININPSKEDSLLKIVCEQYFSVEPNTVNLLRVIVLILFNTR